MKLLLLAAFLGFAAAASYSQDEDSLFYVDEILDEKPITSTFVEKVKARLNKVLEDLQTRAAKREEVLKEFTEKLQAMKEKIANLAEKAGENIFRKIRDLGSDLRTLRIDIFRRLGGKPKEYSTVSEIDGAFLIIKDFFTSEEGIAKAREYIRSLDTRHAMVFLVKAFIENASDERLIDFFQENFKGLPTEGALNITVHEAFLMVEEFLRTEEGLQSVKTHFKELKTDHPIVSRLQALVKDLEDSDIRQIINAFLPLLEEGYQGQSSDVKTRLLSLFSEIRNILITPEGIQAVRDYARGLVIRHPVLFLVKAFIESATDEVLLEILDEIFKPADGGLYAATRLGELFHQVREILDTDEGFQTLKNYLINIKSTHPIVSRLEGFLKIATDDSIKEILDALFPEID